MIDSSWTRPKLWQRKFWWVFENVCWGYQRKRKKLKGRVFRLNNRLKNIHQKTFYTLKLIVTQIFLQRLTIERSFSTLLKTFLRSTIGENKLNIETFQKLLKISLANLQPNNGEQITKKRQSDNYEYNRIPCRPVFVKRFQNQTGGKRPPCRPPNDATARQWSYSDRIWDNRDLDKFIYEH